MRSGQYPSADSADDQDGGVEFKARHEPDGVMLVMVLPAYATVSYNIAVVLVRGKPLV